MIKFLSNYLDLLFKKVAISLQDSNNQGPKDTLFCATYENPYERYYGNQKIIGISTRRFRQKVLIQCIIHLEDGETHFIDTPLARIYSSKGIITHNKEAIQKHITTQLTALCQREPFQWN